MNLRITALLSALGLTALCIPQSAHATLTMDVTLLNIQQLGVGSSAVSLGHVVSARTNLNKLFAGGTMNASCVSEHTGSISARNALPSGLVGVPNVLHVPIPDSVPAVRNIPGFENVPAGAILSCTYAWTARAIEGTYTYGIPGFGTTYGGEERERGDSIGFYMYQSAGDGEPSRGCIH